MGRARNNHQATATGLRSAPDVSDAFANVFGNARSSSVRAQAGAELLVGPVYGSGLPYQVRLLLTDDEPCDNDAGGLHVTAWRQHQGQWYLQRRWPATRLLATLHKSPPVHLQGYRRQAVVFAGPVKVQVRGWLARALGA